MHILLVNPRLLDTRTDAYDTASVPIGLYYIGALLIDNGFTVSLVNLADKPDPLAFFKGRLEKIRPAMVGFSVLNANRLNAVECARAAKKILPDTRVVFGGPSATFLSDYFFATLPELDYIVKGEGEMTFLELAKTVLSGKPASPDRIRGLVYRKGGQPVQTDPRPPIEDLDILPKPGKYFCFQHVALTRGCPGNCTFCGSPRFWGRGNVRFHSAEWFADHLALLNRSGVSHFYVSDDTFTYDKEKVKAICRLILSKKIDITWAAISRVDLIDEDMLYWMRKAGCIQISFGVESGSPQIRKRLGKPVSEEEIVSAFRMTQQYGILARAYFIYGSPGETRETIAESRNLICAIKPLSAVFYVLMVFPGTSLYQTLKNDNRVSDGIWENSVEDIPWCKFDPVLTWQDVRKFGEALRRTFFETVDKFASHINLVDNTDLYPEHARFLSRLAMTFSHGEYATDPRVNNSRATAEVLYTKALSYDHNSDAYLGLSMLLQKKRDFSKASDILEKGLGIFPENRDLTICKGINLMNLQNFDRALACFEKFETEAQVGEYIHICREKNRNNSNERR